MLHTHTHTHTHFLSVRLHACTLLLINHDGGRVWQVSRRCDTASPLSALHRNINILRHSYPNSSWPTPRSSPAFFLQCGHISVLIFHTRVLFLPPYISHIPPHYSHPALSLWHMMPLMWFTASYFTSHNWIHIYYTFVLVHSIKKIIRYYKNEWIKNILKVEQVTQKCAENVLILRPSNMKMSLFLQNALMMDLFLTYMQIFTSQDVNWWTGLMWITCDVFISCLDSHSDGIRSLQRIIASDVMTFFPNLFKLRNTLI